jgi:type I restriction enzyme, S subunit
MAVSPGYEQTEVGVIPEDWEVKAFGRLYAEPSRNGLYKSSEFHGRGTRIVNMGEMFGLDFISDQEMSRVSLTPKEIATSALRNGDLLFGRRSVVPSGAGKCSLVVEPLEPLVFESSIIRVRLEQAEADPLFYFYFFASSTGRSVMAVIISGTNVKGIRGSELRELNIPHPPLPEQHAIATALSDVDALLGGLERLIAKKRDLKSAAMQQLLTGESRLPGFQGPWGPLDMARNSLLKARIGWQGLTTDEYLASGSYYLVTGTDFLAGRVNWATCPFVAAARYEQDRNIQLRRNDVLVTKDGTIGKVAFVRELPGPATLNSGVFVIRPRNKAYEPRFLYHILASAVFEDFLMRLAAGSTITHLYQKDFVSFVFLAPPTLGEQSAIAEALDDMDAELAAYEARRDKIRDLKQAMMQELLTGKTRLVHSDAVDA